MSNPSSTSSPPPPVDSVLDLIGNTPMLKVTKIDTGCCELFLKLENQNPGGSIKDRIAVSMIEAAEQAGLLGPGGTVVEATAGNTGLGLALVGKSKGYRVHLVVPDKMSREKILHLRALGAEVDITRSDVGKGHPDYYHDRAERLAKATPGAFYANQFGNPSNPATHERTTGPEIYAQMNGDVDAIVAGVGSGGTLTGLGRYFGRVSPKTRMVLADPVGSVLAHLVKTGEMLAAKSWAVEGIGEDFVPPNLDLALISEAHSVSDAESFATARLLLQAEGVLGGSSAGTLLATALRYCRAQTTPKRVVTFVCDTGGKYLSKQYNDVWMEEEGFVSLPERTGQVRDLIVRRHADGATVSVTRNDTLRTAFKRMKTADVSQLPVVESDVVLGIVDETDLLHALLDASGNVTFDTPVAGVMAKTLETLSSEAPIHDLRPLFERGHVGIVVDDGRFVGLVTRFDLLNFLRRSN
jgi:cystathionine beta-synthase